MLNDLLVLLTAVISCACVSRNLFGNGGDGLNAVDDLAVCCRKV